MSIIKKCICNKKFKTYQHRIDDGRGKFCSKKCQYRNAKRPSGLKYKIKVRNKGWFTKDTDMSAFKRRVVRWNKHPSFKDGVWSYHREARRIGMGRKCEICGILKKTKRNLLIHHIDHNRRNNNKENWMTVCAKCHCTILHPRKFYGNQFTKNRGSGKRIYRRNYQAF